MMMELRQGTAVTVIFGQFVDKDDGVTPETELAATMAIRLSKNGAAFADRNSATAIAHRESGFYAVHLDATDAATLGRLKGIAVSAGVHLGVWKDFVVVTQAYWDAKYGAGVLPVNAIQVAGDAPAAAALVANIGNLDVAISGLNDLSEADVQAALEQLIGVDAQAELAGVPAANAPLRDKIEWMFMVARNKRTASSLIETVNNAAGSAIAIADISESGSVTTRGKYS